MVDDEGASQPYDDPGWRRAVGRTRPGLFPRGGGRDVDGVTVLRMLFLSLLLAGLLILFVLAFVIEQVGSPEPLPAGAVVGLGLAGVAAARWTANRPLDAKSPDSLAASYRTHFFLGFALNEAPLLLSFVLSFVLEELWPYLLDLPFYLWGMFVIAPSRANIERRQQQVYAQGSTLSLGRALSRMPH